jgi:CubicO group peptidase (beta-lactamase class C family)
MRGFLFIQYFPAIHRPSSSRSGAWVTMPPTVTAPSKLGKVVLRSAAAIILLLAALLAALWLKPPDLLRIGANYSAKIVCSNVFLAGRDPDEVLRTDVQAPGIALLRLVRISVDRQRHVIHAGFLGFIGDGLAVDRPNTGCAVVPDGNLDFAIHVNKIAAQTGAAAVTATATAADPAKTAPGATMTAPSAATAAPGAGTAPLWPEGNAVATAAALDRLLADDTLTGAGMRAVVVVDHGRIVSERYAAGFSAATPLLGWSMAKTVVAGLVGVLVKEGRLTLDQFAGWATPGGDGREHIRIADLLSMSSGLHFNEGYGAVSDVTRMLYLEPDMSEFARAQPLAHPVGEFWSYSSGTANILSRIVQDAGGRLGAGVAAEKIFKPLGMASAIIETDEDGTLVGSSYMYATARDWARYAQFLLQDGVWRGQEMLPRGYVAMMASPVAASGGQYGHGLVWLWASETASDIPADTFWMAGHDGQSIAIIPSRQLAVVRLGLTPELDHYQPQPLIKAILDATK